ncbi:TPA: Lysine-specific demethylase 8 [Trebouxia sp. C0004]
MFRKKTARLLIVALRPQCRGLSSDVQRLAYNASPPTKLQEQLLLHPSPVPLVVTGAMNNWQARDWTRSDLMQYGDTIVPVEISHNGGDYRDLHNASSTRRFEADLEVPLSAVLQSMQDTDTRQQPVQSLLYAAQVDLISLIPALEQGTITPLHCDPYFNLFCQIWGSKYIRIYDRKHAQQLHPFSNPFLRNTSQVRVEKVDSKMFPSFDQVPYLECHLMPGEMLFMPKKFWHFVQALEPSWSVSYWWT